MLKAYSSNLMRRQTDQQLIRAYLKGDDKSLEVLILRYLKPIYGFVYRYAGNAQNAEDITQETFIKVWRNLKKYNKNKSFKSWIYTIAKNTAFDFLKKKKTIPFSEFENVNGENILFNKLISSALSPDKIVERINIKNMLSLAMEKLSSKYRLVLSLYYENCLNFREIAETLGEPLNTVKSRHRRGLVLLRFIIND